MLKIVVLGAKGMLGSRLMYYWRAQEQFQCIGLSRENFDFNDDALLEKNLKSIQADIVINAAAYAHVDGCEENPQRSYDANVAFVEKLLKVASELQHTRLFHFSTDFVFDGGRGGYTETDAINPLSVYGKHKAEAEKIIRDSKVHTTIFRIASLQGAGEGKRDFIKMLLGKTHCAVNNEFHISLSTPRFIADVLKHFIITQPKNGIYHCVADGHTTWFELAQHAFQTLHINIPIDPIAANAFPMKAPRPPNSWLKNDKLKKVMGELPTWQKILDEQIADLQGVYLKKQKDV